MDSFRRKARALELDLDCCTLLLARAGFADAVRDCLMNGTGSEYIATKASGPEPSTLSAAFFAHVRLQFFFFVVAEVAVPELYFDLCIPAGSCSAVCVLCGKHPAVVPKNSHSKTKGFTER